MSTKITIEISLTADEQPNAREQAILNSMAAHPANGAAATPVVSFTKPAEAAPAAAPAKAAPAAEVKRGPGRPPKAAPAPASAASTTPAVLDTTLDEEVLEEEAPAAEDDLLGGEEAATVYTKADAIAKATQLVSAQKQAVVKAALAQAGAKRVSDLDEESIQVFMAALEA